MVVALPLPVHMNDIVIHFQFPFNLVIPWNIVYTLLTQQNNSSNPLRGTFLQQFNYKVVKQSMRYIIKFYFSLKCGSVTIIYSEFTDLLMFFQGVKSWWFHVLRINLFLAYRVIARKWSYLLLIWFYTLNDICKFGFLFVVCCVIHTVRADLILFFYLINLNSEIDCALDT